MKDGDLRTQTEKKRDQIRPFEWSICRGSENKKQKNMGVINFCSLTNVILDPQ